MLEGAETCDGEQEDSPMNVLERHENTGPAVPWLLALTAKFAEDDASDDAVLALSSSTTGRRERVLLDCCSAGSLCPPRLESKAIRPSKANTYKSATGGVLHTSGRQTTTMRTVLENALVAHDFEVSRQDYQPNVLIMAAGNLTTNGCRIVLDDEGSYIENKISGQRLVVEKRNNIYEFAVEIVETAAKIPCDDEAMVLPLSAAEATLGAALDTDEHTMKAELGEARAVHYRKTPRQPTGEEIAQHEISHVPHRDWCRYCVGGRGRIDRHLRLHGENRLVPVLSFDPFFPGQKEDGRPPVAMSFFDSDTKRLAITMLPSKSNGAPIRFEVVGRQY